MPENVRLQDLRDFTVQIRDPENKEIIGTGVVISKDRIITCAHVVEAAIGRLPQEAGDSMVGVYFPRFESREPLSIHAIVDCCLLEHEDDIVLLKLVDGRAPLGPEQLALLGSAEQSEGHIFRSYGYSPTGEYPATRAEGSIRGSVEGPEGKNLIADPIQLSSQEIDRGMSGSAVLDTELNRVVGLVAARYFPKGWIKGNISYAVDNRVLTFNPFLFPLQNEPNPLRPAPEPRIDKAEARAAVAKDLGQAWNSAPPILAEWVGRKGLLSSITGDWIDSKKRVTGFIGFGGEGKSSLARRWVDGLLADQSLPQPDSLFWWGFYERPNMDEFFEAALNFLSGGRIDACKIPSTSLRAQIIGAMLGAGRYLFVLDGLEVLQYQDGDLYGSFRSPDLKAFLEFFASPEHDSFCLVTSRAPLMDMEEYTTYQHRDVDRLNLEDGRDLLSRLGVQGKEEDLDRVVADWDGHALTLSLLASYLVDHCGGDIKQINNIPPPTASESRYDRVHRVLRRYDEHFDNTEKAFLKLFSILRIPVPKKALAKLCRAKSEKGTSYLMAPIIALSDAKFLAMVERLEAYRILRLEPREHRYTIHPLIRDHYFRLLTEGGQEQIEEAHQQIKDYYLPRSRYIPHIPTLNGLKIPIEFVHHACLCGSYDEALKMHIDHILRKNEFYLTHKLGAWERELEIMEDFFPGGDFNQDPLVTLPEDKSWVLNEVGLCLEIVGKGGFSRGVLERALNISVNSDNWGSASVGYTNLSILHLHRGELPKGLQSATQSLKMAKRAKRKDFESNSLYLQAWALHLQGYLKDASRIFRKAEMLENENNILSCTSDGPGDIYYAEHLRRIGDADNSRRAIEATLDKCERRIYGTNDFSQFHQMLTNFVLKCAERFYHIGEFSKCYRVLGDLYIDACEGDKVRESYDLALDISRNTTNRIVLIEALIAKGRWEARNLRDSVAALGNLTEALDYAKAGGYRLYEADTRVALAWAHLAAGNEKSAREEAEYALQMSEGMGYYWGKVDANEVLRKIASREVLTEIRDPH